MLRTEWTYDDMIDVFELHKICSNDKLQRTSFVPFLLQVNE